MNAILFAIVTWVLTQLLFVWLCARLAAVRDLDMKDHLELRAYLVRAGLDADACDPSALPTIAAPTNAAARRPELFQRCQIGTVRCRAISLGRCSAIGVEKCRSDVGGCVRGRQADGPAGPARLVAGLRSWPGGQMGSARRYPISRRVLGASLMAAAALLLPASAGAAERVLEYVIPSRHFPVAFTTEGGALGAQMAGFERLVHCAASHGEGEITGPRSTVSRYTFTGCATEHGAVAKCKSQGANEEEIRTGPIEATLVYIDQARREVGELLNPDGGIYIAFECGGETAEGRGPFLAPVAPVNTEAATFTATLTQAGSLQSPDEYENELGEKRIAIPEGRRGSHEWVSTGVESTFTVHSTAPGLIKSVTSEEIEAKRHEEESARQQQLRREEEAITSAANQRHHEEEAATAAASQRHQEEAAAATAGRKRHEEEAAAAARKRQEEEAKPKATPTRAQLLARALHKCKLLPKKRRGQCEASAHKKYGRRARSGKIEA
jgi:hypothetical protein